MTFVTLVKWLTKSVALFQLFKRSGATWCWGPWFASGLYVSLKLYPISWRGIEKIGGTHALYIFSQELAVFAMGEKRRPQTANCRLETRGKLQSEGKL